MSFSPFKNRPNGESSLLQSMIYIYASLIDPGCTCVIVSTLSTLPFDNLRVCQDLLELPPFLYSITFKKKIWKRMEDFSNVRFQKGVNDITIKCYILKLILFINMELPHQQIPKMYIFFYFFSTFLSLFRYSSLSSVRSG